MVKNLNRNNGFSDPRRGHELITKELILDIICNSNLVKEKLKGEDNKVE
jgi:hypothetical protein